MCRQGPSPPRMASRAATQRALAWSLLELPLDMADECGTEPPLAEGLADACHTFPVIVKRRKSWRNHRCVDRN